MLGDHPISPVLLATDLAQRRAFYHDRLGLEIIAEREGSIDFRCGATQLNVNLSTTGTADTQTQAGWRVTDLRSEVAELRARGVDVQEYDLPGLKTKDGIADIGFAWRPGSSTRAVTPWRSSSRSPEAPARAVSINSRGAGCIGH